MSGAQSARLPDGRLHLQHGPIDLVIGADGDAAAVEAAHASAWRRFESVLAEHLDPSEAELWSVAGGLLADEAVRHGADPAAAPLRRLLDGPDLPAKANLTSVVRRHSEEPAWVGVLNPLRSRRGT